MKSDTKNNRVIVSVSGGVDSSVAAALLKEQGYDIIGVFMRLWSDPNIPEEEAVEVTNKCCTLEAYNDVRALSTALDFPVYTIDYAEKFKQLIVDHFIDGYAKGITPNPCVQCNKFIKFNEVFTVADKFDAQTVASGHYAQIKEHGGTYHLYRGADAQKDQTYFLYNLTQDQLARIMFPVGAYQKTEIRALAKKFGLPMHAKKDSTEICFVPSTGYKDFLARYITVKKGPIKTADGTIVGEHEGLPYYTRGQRKGLDISDGHGPYFVIRADMSTNTLYVSNNPNDVLLTQAHVHAIDTHWIAGESPQVPVSCTASIRYGHCAKAMLQSVADKELSVDFSVAQRGVMPGQSLVIYDESNTGLLGGGIIIE